MKIKYFAVTVAAMAALAVQASAQTAVTQDVTSVSTSSAVSPGSPTTASVPGSGSGGFSSGTTYSVTYDGEVTTIDSFTGGTGAGTVNYAPLSYAGTITTTLQSVTGSTVSSTPAINLLYNNIVSSSGTSYEVAAPYIGNEATAFDQNNFNLGTDNVFGNQGDGNGDNNNIERVDVVFGNGLTANDALSFAIFERGATSAHDTFQIAAITGVDGSGNPTSYGQLASFGSGTAYGSYGQTALSGYANSTDWLVSRSASDGSVQTADDPSTTVSGQSIGGVTVSVTQTGSSGLGITAGTEIYGYSLFGDDVPSNATSAQLVDLTDQSVFPQDTSSGTGAGGIDLLAYTGVAFTAVDTSAVPEPREYAMYFLTTALAILVGRRILRRQSA